MPNKYILNRIKEISLALAGKTEQIGRCRHFSFILKKNRIISIGVNKYKKTHPITLRFKYPNYVGVHSELDAILKFGLTDCAGLTIVNTRINNNNKFDTAAPCRYCAGMLNEMNFKSIVCTDKNGEWIDI